jgi:hypothetical protein
VIATRKGITPYPAVLNFLGEFLGVRMGKIIDLTGKKYNRLTVIRKVDAPKHIKNKRKQSYWLCKCDCGKEKEIAYCNIVSGNIKSCGCYKDELILRNWNDLTGKRFGKLIVIKRTDKPILNKKRGPYYLCKCDCAKEKIVWGENLTYNRIVSCGCYRESTKKRPYGEAAKNARYSAYKHDADKRNIVFSLSKEQFVELATQDCFYCGSKPFKIEKNKSNNGDFIYNGIDRIDNTRGYIEGNMVTCCIICNRAKNSMSSDDFYNWINRLCKYNSKTKRK